MPIWRQGNWFTARYKEGSKRLNIVVTILASILVFGVIIFIHELGHFIAARGFGVTVDEFAMGMGPAIFKKEFGGITYSLRIFPIGGFCKMLGEDMEEEEEKSDDPGLFYNKPCWQRIIILAAGATMNLVLGILLSFVMTLCTPAIPTNTVAFFEENASSKESGLQLEDEIIRINGIRIFTDKDIINSLLTDEDGVYEFVVKRGGEKLTLKDVKLGSNGGSLILDFKVYAYQKGFLNTVSYSARSFLSITRSIWLSLGELIRGNVGFKDLSGPVGVGEVIGQAVSAGWETFLYIAAFITVNIGVFNLLPVPALDGGRLLFVLLEMIRRKPVAAKYEGVVHFVGLAFLLLLMIAVTAKDIVYLFIQ